MKNKTTTAALLSILALAGLAVTDAYAQSNTQRLADIDDATTDILEDTEVIADSFTALTDMLTAIQDSLAALTTSLAEVMSAITGVEDAVNGVNDKLSGMETAVYNTESSIGSVGTAVTDLSTEVGAISSKIMDMDAMMTGVSDLDDRLAGIEAAIVMLDNSMMSMDGGGDTSDALAVLSATVLSNDAKLNEVLQRLANLEDGQRQLGADVEGISVGQTSAPGNILLEGETELNVDSYDYKTYGDVTTDTAGRYYELEMTFSCSTDVFVDTVSMVHDGAGALQTSPPYALSNTANDGSTGYEMYFGHRENADYGFDNEFWNFVTVDNRNLFDTLFRFSASALAQTYNLPAVFNNKPLEAGEALRFKSQVYDRVTDVIYDRDGTPSAPILGIDAATVTPNLFTLTNRTHSLPFYEINVDWLTYESGTTCSLGFGSSGVSTPGLTESNTLTYGVATDPAHADRSLKDFSNTINCGGEPVEITDITVDTADEWRLAGFVNVNLEYGSMEHTLEFDPSADDAVITNDGDFLPIYLGNDELQISGSIPLDNLLVSLTYNSGSDTDCMAESDY